MFESLAAITLTIKGLIDSITVRKFIFWFFSFLIIILASTFIYEYLTENFYYNRLCQKVEIIIKIDNQTKNDSIIQCIVKKEYATLLKEVSEIRSNKTFKIGKVVNISKTEKEGVFKFLSAWIVPLLIIVFGRIGESQNEKNNLLIGGIIIGLLGSVGAIFIPTIFNPWVNYIGFPLSEFFVLSIIGRYMD